MAANIPCIADIIAASATRLTARAAGYMLRVLADRTEAVMAKTGLSRADAAAKVHGEAVAREKFRAAKGKRNALMDHQTSEALFDRVLALNTGRKLMGDRLHDIVGQVWSKSKQMQAVEKGRFYASLESNGIGEWFREMTPDQAKQFFFALDDVQRKQSSKSTISPEARKAAELRFTYQQEAAARMNKAGADVNLTPGRIFMQTHDIAKLRSMESKDVARDWWKTFVASQNVDWEKTLEGSSTLNQDEWLNRFFEDIYNKVHPNALDNSRPSDSLPGGSLANKASASRVLWFKDAESAWNYQSEMGIHKQDIRRLSNAEMDAAARTTVMLENFGTRPDAIFENVRNRLEKHVNDPSFTDSAKQVESLRTPKVTAALTLLDGRSESSVNPTFSAWTDNLKAWAILSKMGGASLTAFFGDRPAMMTQMHHIGATAAEIAGMQFDTISPNTTAGKELLSRLGMQGEAMTHAIREWWTDMRVNRWAMAATQKMLDYTGLTKVTESHREAAAKYISFLWGRDSDTPFNALPERRRFHLEKYDIGPDEWNLVRQHAFQVDDHKAITPDLAHLVPDADIDRALGLPNPSPLARERWRNELEAKLHTYLRQNVDASMGQPSFTERNVMTLYGQPRGTIPREAAELIGLLKGFPLATFNRTVERARELGGVMKPAFLMQTAAMIAESIVAGYAVMTTKDLLGGRTRRKLVDENGEINPSVFWASALRGGGLGIYGDFLFGEYDKRYKSAFGAFAGPVIGQADPLLAMLTKAKNLGKGEFDANVESLGYDALRFGQDNAPFLNMFYLKPILDHFIFWHLKEGLSPGVFRRTQQNVEDNNYQTFWIEPSL